MKSMFYDLLDEEDVTAVSALPIQWTTSLIKHIDEMQKG
jgi:hypothetical protein